MAVEILTTPPRVLVAGDTYKWRVSDGQRLSSDGWELSLGILGTNPPVTVAGDVEVDGSFLLTLASATTAAIPPGDYAWSLMFEKDNERETTQRGFLRILPDPTQVLAPSALQLSLTQAEEALEALSSGTNQSVNIDGQQYTKRSMDQLLEYMDGLRVRIAAERRRLGLPASTGRRTIVTRF